MAFSRRVLERRQRREEKRRQAELERRQAADLEQQQDEERREAARLEAEERDAQLDAARAQRVATLARLRTQKLAERRAEAERTEHRDALLEILRAARQQARQTALDEVAQRTALRQSLLEARRAERQQAEQAQARRTEALQAQLAEQRAAEQEAEGQATERQAALRSRLAEQRSADRAEERRETARRAQQDEQRESERAEAQRAEARQARRAEASAEEQTARQAAAQREAARESRQAERREAEQDLAQIEARRELAAQARRDERQAQDKAAQQAAARRSAAGEARLAERREEEQAVTQTEARREAARQTGRADQHTAERAPTRRQADRALERTAKRAAAESGSRRATPAQIETPPPHDPLQDRIPSGTLSGALPWLRVVGNRLVTLAGDPITLRGLSLLGLERAEPHPQQGFAAGAGLTAESFEALLGWGVNVVRVALNRSRVLNGYGDFSAWDYLSELDGIIQQAANRGAYTLLSLRQLDETTVFGTRPGPNGERLPNYIAPQPDYDTIGMWRVLGERYADEPAVLFDLYTAPHPPLPDDLTGYDSDWDLWTLWVQMMVAELRRLHPRAICWVSGLAEATDLSGFPILGTAGDPIPNLIYAAHLYPRRANPWPALQALARTQAVFVTEWGGERGDLAWGERAALALRGSSLSWTAAHWNAEPHLAARPSRGPITPTPFGAVVQRALALAGERLTVTPPVLPAALNAIATR
jgi:hypothetical protein